jgi:hypothetical protein
VLGVFVSAAVLRGLRSATGGRSDDVLLALGLAMALFAVGSAVWRELRDGGRPV